MRRGRASWAFALAALATAVAALAVAGSRAPDPTATPTPPPPPATTAAPKAAPAPDARPPAPKAEAARGSQGGGCRRSCRSAGTATRTSSRPSRRTRTPATRGKGKKPDPEDMCSTCHGDGTAHIESGGDASMISTMKGADGLAGLSRLPRRRQGVFHRRAGLLLEGDSGFVRQQRARQLGRGELPHVPLDARLRPEEHESCSRRRPASSAPPATRRRPPRSRTSPTRTASTAAG